MHLAVLSPSLLEPLDHLSFLHPVFLLSSLCSVRSVSNNGCEIKKIVQKLLKMLAKLTSAGS